MENASKALIIAAAVIIGILLISSAIFIVTSASESLHSSRNSMTELQIYSFNQKFTSFEGKRKANWQVNQLLKTIASSNSSNNNQIAVKLSGFDEVLDSSRYAIFDESNKMIKCNASKIVSLDEIVAKVNNNKTYNYTVTLYYCNEKTRSMGNNKDLKPVAGCILLIHIHKN